MSRRVRLAAALGAPRVALLALVLVGIGIGASDAAPRPRIVVSAAASLTDALQEIKAQFMKQEPGWDVVLNFGASGALQLQIENGAPVDVFASAGMPPMKALLAKGLIDSSEVRIFARNQLVLIVPEEGRGGAPGSPAPTHGSDPAAPPGHADSLGAVQVDLSRILTSPRMRRIALGEETTVPAGRYAIQTLKRFGVFEALKTKLVPAQDVRQVLEYVATGSVDAGFVYATDVKPGASVRVIARIPDEAHEPILYPIAPLKNGEEPGKALTFVQFVLSPRGQEILQGQGFLRPAK